MAITETQSWDRVDELLAAEERLPGQATVSRVAAIRELAASLRDPNFPYLVYPEFESPALHVYPDWTYDFDFLCGRRFTFEVQVRPTPRRSGKPWVEVQVEHIAGNDRLETYETRRWTMDIDRLLVKLPDFFDEVEWPRRLKAK